MKTQISQVEEFNNLPCIGRCKTLDLLKSFPSYDSQLSGASLTWEWLMAARWQAFFFLGSGILLLGLRNSHLKGQNPWWLWHTCLLIQQEILHFTYTVSVSLSIPKKGNVKECSNYRTIVLISHASKVMLKIVQVRLQQYMNCELPDVQAGKDWRWEEKGTTEEEMVGWHHQLNGHEFE